MPFDRLIYIGRLREAAAWMSRSPAPAPTRCGTRRTETVATKCDRSDAVRGAG